MKKTYKINYTAEELITLRDTNPNVLMFFILENDWMKGTYTNDWEQNERLQIVRFFYNKRKPAAPSQIKADKQGQTKLL